MDDKVKRALDRRMAGAALPVASKARMIQTAIRGKGSRRVRKRKMVITAAAVAAVMVSGCFAVQVIHDNIRQTMTSWEQTHEGTPLNLSQSDAGYTVTLDEIYGDARYVYLNGTLSRNDGQMWKVDPMTDRLGTQYTAAGFCERRFQIPNQETLVSYGSKLDFLSDTNPEDDTLEFIVRLDAAEFALTGDATAVLDGIWYETNGELFTLDGHWEITFPVDRKNDGETLEINQTITLENGTVTLERLYFSALDVSADWSGENEALFGEAWKNTYLLLKSGEQIPYQSRGIVNGDGTEIRMEFEQFNKGLGHISADDVQAVVFAGQEIPIA